MGEDPTAGSADWAEWRRTIDLDDYEARFDRIAARGGNPHGEVDFVMRFAPTSALDAGCGFGRVAIELHARGVDVVGVDLDRDLLDRARRRAPDLDWRLDDLARFDAGRTFDLVVVAGNVIGFVDPPDRVDAVRTCARHVGPGGRLVFGTQLRADWPSIDDYDRWVSETGLVPSDRFAGWDGASLTTTSDYAVLVFARPD